MSYNTSTRVSSTDRAIAGLLVAGVMFVLGYTVVRTSLSQTTERAIPEDAEVVIPHQAALWADFATQY